MNSNFARLNSASCHSPSPSSPAAITTARATKPEQVPGTSHIHHISHPSNPQTACNSNWNSICHSHPHSQVRGRSAPGGVRGLPLQPKQGLRGLLGDGIVLHSPHRDALRLREDWLCPHVTATAHCARCGKLHLQLHHYISIYVCVHHFGVP